MSIYFNRRAILQLEGIIQSKVREPVLPTLAGWTRSDVKRLSSMA